MLDSRAKRRFLANRGAVAGLVIVGGLVAFSLLGPMLSAHDPFESQFAAGGTATGMPVGPSSEFWLGTDRLFRDQFVRLALGGRLSLLIAVSATFIASTLGAIVGIVAGYNESNQAFRITWVTVGATIAAMLAWLSGKTGWAAIVALVALSSLIPRVKRTHPWLSAGMRFGVDGVLMRFVDVLLSFPFLLLVMAIGAAIDRTTVGSILLVLGATGWLGTARVLRAKTMQIRALDFVTASRALGQRTLPILVRHVLPNVMGPLIVIATAQVAQMIIAESVLSYLGAGVSPPTPTWGHMLFEGQDYYEVAPWLVAGPGVVIVLAVVGFNLVGEGLRDALDPSGDRP